MRKGFIGKIHAKTVQELREKLQSVEPSVGIQCWSHLEYTGKCQHNCRIIQSEFVKKTEVFTDAFEVFEYAEYSKTIYCFASEITSSENKEKCLLISSNISEEVDWGKQVYTVGELLVELSQMPTDLKIISPDKNFELKGSNTAGVWLELYDTKCKGGVTLNKHLWEEILKKENTLKNWQGYLDWCLAYGILLEEFQKYKEAYDLFEQALHISRTILQFQKDKWVISCLVAALDHMVKNPYQSPDEIEPLEYLLKNLTYRYHRDLDGTKFGSGAKKIHNALMKKYEEFHEKSMFSGEGMELLDSIFESMIEPETDIEEAAETWSKEHWQTEIEAAIAKMNVTKEQITAIWEAIDIIIKEVNGELLYTCSITEYENQMEQKWETDKSEENACRYLFWIENSALHHSSISQEQPWVLMQYRKKIVKVLAEYTEKTNAKIYKRTCQTFELLKAMEKAEEVSMQLLECKRDLQFYAKV